MPQSPSFDALGFRELRRQSVKELGGEIRLLRHTSGAEVLVVDNDDTNRVFCIGLRTPPTNATGVEHIMEHSVLSGSKRYPLRDPFVEMVKSSLYTFLNAMTFPDRTIYPVASQNGADFANLTRVYLDAVYAPLITEDTFKREAWHYEVDAETKALRLSGVVFNEMKGNYSNPMALLSDGVTQELFPETFLRFDSGGDPLCIPDLSYQAFSAFHKQYYSAPNSRIFIYGKDAVAIALPLVREYLESAGQVEPPRCDWGLQQPFAAPRRVERSYPVDSLDDPKSFVVLNWGYAKRKDPSFILLLRVLEEVLLGSDGAPLRKALIQSGLGEGIVGHGFDAGCHQLYFSFGLQGVRNDGAAQVEALMLSVLDTLHRQGISQELLAAALHSVEFSVREDANAKDKGMRAMYRSYEYWNYDLDPIAPHCFEEQLARMRSELAQTPRLFEELIATLFLKNNHRLLLILKPKVDFVAERESKEAERLESVAARLSDKDRSVLSADAERLAALATQPDDPKAIAALPQLQLKDLDPNIKRTPTELLNWEMPVLAHDLDTHGIVYLDWAANLRGIDFALLPYAQVLARLMFAVGTTQCAYDDFSIRIASKTGGLWASLLVQPVRGSERTDARFVLHAKVLDAHVPSVFELWGEALTTLRLNDRSRILNVLKESRAAAEQRVISEGMRLAMQRASAGFHLTSHISDMLGGIGAIEGLRAMIKEAEESWPVFQGKLEAVQRYLLSGKDWLLNISCAKSGWERVRQSAQPLSGLMGKAIHPDAEWRFEPKVTGEGIYVPSDMNYVAQSFVLPEARAPYHGSMLVLLNALWSSWLWNRIRVQGGAYGSACIFNRDTRIFSLGSYRDPHVARTLEVFGELSRQIETQAWNDDDVRRAIIGCIGQMDAPQTPEHRGREAMNQFFSKRSEDDLQKVREEVLKTTKGDITRWASALGPCQKQARVVVLGSEQLIRAQAPALSGTRLL